MYLLYFLCVDQVLSQTCSHNPSGTFTALMFQSHRVQSPVRGTHTVSYFLFLREHTWLLACIWFQMSQKAQLGNTGLLCHFYTFLQGPVYGLTVSDKHVAALKEETHNR